MAPSLLTNEAPHPARGSYADGFAPVAECFAAQIAAGREVGAALSVYRRGRPIVDLWGGTADSKAQRPWQRDTRVIVFSVTKGLAAMAMHLLADRGAFDWDQPVIDHWPAFAAASKDAITIRQLLNHRAGIPCIDTPLSMDDCTSPERRDKVRAALESQAPLWAPGERQAYHAVSYGLYVAELFERIAGEPMGPYLRREWFDVVGSDAHLGTPASEDARQAALYGPSMAARLAKLAALAAWDPHAPEARIARTMTKKSSVIRRAFANPNPGPRGALAYNDIAVRRASLAWASATASADGIARAYLPFASSGRYEQRALIKPETLAPLHARQSWSMRDGTLQKPLGWSQGFLKEQRHVFCPNPESYGHAGMGGSLGWCDPVDEIALGYVMNKMDWRVRSPRCLALCRSLYDCEPLCGS